MNSAKLMEAKKLGIDIDLLINERKSEIERKQKQQLQRQINYERIVHLKNYFPVVVVRPFTANRYIWILSRLFELDGCKGTLRTSTEYGFRNIFPRDNIKDCAFGIFEMAALFSDIKVKTIVPSDRVVYKKSRRAFQTEKIFNPDELFSDRSENEINVEKFDELLNKPKQTIGEYLICKDFIRYEYGGKVSENLIKQSKRELFSKRRNRQVQDAISHAPEIVEVDAKSDVGYVYLMSHANGLTKIGYSKYPKAREKTLQAEDPRLELIWKRKGTIDDERTLHAIFHKKRKRGEWFDLSQSDIEQIKEGK